MITVATQQPADLLNKIKAAIRDGSVETWAFAPGDGFTHATRDGQWEGHAHLEPSAKASELVLRYVPTKPREPDAPDSATLRGVYHGRFIEMLVTHFRDDLDEITVSFTKK